MALTFQGPVKSSELWGICTKIEARQQATGSFVNVGRFSNFTFTLNPLSMKGDPANTDYVHAVQYVVAFSLHQTGKSNEVAMLTGTAGTGLFQTDMELKLTFVSGTVITLGAVSGYPLRLVAGYTTGSEEESARIPIKAENIEPITAFPTKVA